jgi:hypothetical protein
MILDSCIKDTFNGLSLDLIQQPNNYHQNILAANVFPTWYAACTTQADKRHDLLEGVAISKVNRSMTHFSKFFSPGLDVDQICCEF